jgi:flagellar biosynthesis protein FlhF
VAAAVATPVVVAAEPNPQAGAVPSELQVLKNEIGSLRHTLEQQLAGLAWKSLRQNQPRRYAVLRALSELGIAPSLARTIAEELPEATSADRARFLPLGFLARRIPVAPTDAILDGGIYALVGPTGVGKTTTIAKLAARFAEIHGTRDIALVAMDHYRIGAQEQLYTYGRLLGVTVHTVTPAQPLAATLERLADRKLVLIDTVGMSPRDPALDTQIAQLAAAHPQLRAFLMLAANAQADDQEEVARRFGAARLAGCIISKIDETMRIGGALSVAIQQRLPIAYFTDGQRVPEDLQIARADQLVIRAMQLARQSPVPPDDETLALMHEGSLLAAATAGSPIAGGVSHV